MSESLFPYYQAKHLTEPSFPSFQTKLSSKPTLFLLRNNEQFLRLTKHYSVTQDKTYKVGGKPLHRAGSPSYRGIFTKASYMDSTQIC